MSPHDRLLAWASEVGAGSWKQWKDACDHLGLEPTESARNLSALGHTEFDWIDNRFACTPPTAAFIPRSSGSVIVTGARPRWLRPRLEQACEDERFDVYFHPPVAQRKGPKTWLIEAEPADLEAFCAETGLRFEVDPGRRILELTPRLSLAAAAEPDRPRERFPRAWVDPEALLDHYDAPPDREGLWMVREWRRDEAFLMRGGRWYRVPVREHGVYLAYPRRRFLAYQRSRQRLLVPDAAPLPPLLARGATLQSGRLPLPCPPRRHAYVNISEDMLELIVDRLGGVNVALEE
ncbi:MAG TPA: hypothetical protein VKY90_01585 [Candidatus Dormibacteraeota bacterium]|nr:hypothetical protein [Candidatus Dormibacteraeota bacterium]